MLSLKAIAKSYGGASARQIFKDVSLQLDAGDCIAVMGESGAGKSTLLNIIAGLDTPDSGEVLLENVSMSSLEDKARTLLRRARIGFVFQAFHLLPHLSIADNVALPLSLNGHTDITAQRRVAELLTAVGLNTRATDFPRELSGGEMQRVAVARALAHQPALLLADEPTGNLDTESANLVLRLLREQAKHANAMLILVTHSLSAARTMDRVLQLRMDGLTEFS